jgi:hypothetical protein
MIVLNFFPKVFCSQEQFRKLKISLQEVSGSEISFCSVLHRNLPQQLLPSKELKMFLEWGVVNKKKVTKKIIPPDTKLGDLFLLLSLKGEILDVMQGHIKSRARW